MPQASETPIEWSGQTEDGVQIFGKHYPATLGKSVVLVHMLGRDKESWNDFAAKLQNNGFGVLSIDLRGHGESGGENYGSFTVSHWNAAVNDIKTAVDSLKQAFDQKVYLIGASIGANLVLNYVAKDASIQKIVLLSPGLDYRGVKTEQAMQEFGNRKMLIVASSEDTYSFSSSKTLFELAAGQKEFKQYENKGH